jgi:hypothetical protein
MPRCKYCGIPIRFNPAFKSESGKFIPLEDATDEFHNCPENPYNSSKGSGSGSRGVDGVDTEAIENAISNMENKIDAFNKNILKRFDQLAVAVETVKMRVEGQMALPHEEFQTVAGILTKSKSVQEDISLDLHTNIPIITTAGQRNQIGHSACRHERISW